MTQNVMTEELHDLVQTMEDMEAFVDELEPHEWAKFEEDEDLQAVLDGHRDNWEKALVMHIFVDIAMADGFDQELTPKHDWLKPYLDMAMNYRGLMERTRKVTKQKRTKRAKK